MTSHDHGRLPGWHQLWKRPYWSLQALKGYPWFIYVFVLPKRHVKALIDLPGQAAHSFERSTQAGDELKKSIIHDFVANHIAVGQPPS